MLRDARFAVTQALALYLRRSPIEAARWRLIPFALRELRAQRPSRRTTVRTRRQFSMVCDLGEWLGQHVYVTGDWENVTADLIKSCIQPGDTVLDIGANAGFFTLVAASSVGPSGRVIAFEPVSTVASLLKENIAINQFGNVTVRSEALSDRAGEAEFFLGSAAHTGIASLRSRNDATGTIKVTLARLDDLLPQETSVRFVKIDVEGAELAVLRGMAHTLKRDNLELVVEITDRFLKESGSCARDVLKLMEGYGYSSFLIEWNGLEPIGDNRELPDQFNAFFTRSPHRVAPGLLAPAA